MVDPHVEDGEGHEGEDAQEESLRHVHVETNVHRVVPVRKLIIKC